MLSSATGLPDHASEGDSTTYRFIFAVGFLVFLAIALVAQPLGLNWRSWLPGAEGVVSITGGVRSAVYTFMSHLF